MASRRPSNQWDAIGISRKLRLRWWSFAKRLHRYPINGRHRSLRAIASELAKAGYTDSKGKAFSAQSVKNMLEGRKR